MFRMLREEQRTNEKRQPNSPSKYEVSLWIFRRLDALIKVNPPQKSTTYICCCFAYFSQSMRVYGSKDCNSDPKSLLGFAPHFLCRQSVPKNTHGLVPRPQKLHIMERMSMQTRQSKWRRERHCQAPGGGLRGVWGLCVCVCVQAWPVETKLPKPIRS